MRIFRRDNTRKWRREFRELHANLSYVTALIGPAAISREQAGEVARIQMALKALHGEIGEQITKDRDKGRDTTELSFLAAEVTKDRNRVRDEILR
jgi:hypothetical protein